MFPKDKTMPIGFIKWNLRAKNSRTKHKQAGLVFLPSFSFLIIGIFAGFSVFLMVEKASAETINVCVICNDPGKVYQCAYNAPLSSSSVVNLQGLQFACIQEIAEFGNHSQCAANRKTVVECNGIAYSLKHTPVQVPAVQLQEEGLDASPSEELTQTPKEQPPTLVDSTAKTFNKTKDTVEKGYETTKDTVKDGYKTTTSTISETAKSVGSTISDAASSTYNCLTSLFSNC